MKRYSLTEASTALEEVVQQYGGEEMLCAPPPPPNGDEAAPAAAQRGRGGPRRRPTGTRRTPAPNGDEAEESLAGAALGDLEQRMERIIWHDILTCQIDRNPGNVLVAAGSGLPVAIDNGVGIDDEPHQTPSPLTLYSTQNRNAKFSHGIFKMRVRVFYSAKKMLDTVHSPGRFQ